MTKYMNTFTRWKQQFYVKGAVLPWKKPQERLHRNKAIYGKIFTALCLFRLSGLIHSVRFGLKTGAFYKGLINKRDQYKWEIAGYNKQAQVLTPYLLNEYLYTPWYLSFRPGVDVYSAKTCILFTGWFAVHLNTILNRLNISIPKLATSTAHLNRFTKAYLSVKPRLFQGLKFFYLN